MRLFNFWGRPCSHHLRELDSQSTVCAIQYAPKVYSGECGRPTFEVKEEQLSFLIDQGFQVPVIAQLFRVSTQTIERRMTKYGLSISGRLSTTLYLNCYSHYVHKGSLNVIKYLWYVKKFKIAVIELSLLSNVPLFREARKRGYRVNTKQNWPFCLVCMSNRW